ncbi:hypothetical protein ATO10_12229 [Actibacterium atlanticum]|uniref:EamA domain-containing protein n=1 Tax=Actibacterium atlanticum TaxID=1461693 RepID=A0A058ZII0_9RHOB|nr:DMT family transporter [Actibacterium atlanticum]KCV81373.1 hypothetical protein ATO10_12229 [Actibacterium atlanticum]
MSLVNWAVIVLLGIGWGSSFFFNEVLLRELGPFGLSLGRVGLGALGCWIYLAATGGLRGASMREARQFLLIGLVQYGLPFSIYALAQQYITGGAAGIINALTPVMVVIVAHFWPGRERATVLKSIGVAIGFSGIVLLAVPALQAGGGSQLWAILFAALAPVCYAIAVNYTKAVTGVPHAAMAAWGLTMATLFLAPVTLIMEGVPVVTRPESWASLAMVGFVLTSASFIVFYWVLARVGPLATSTVTYVAPISAVLLGVWFLNEQLLWPQLAGMGAIFTALLLIDGRLVRLLRPKGNHQPDG